MTSQVTIETRPAPSTLSRKTLSWLSLLLLLEIWAVSLLWAISVSFSKCGFYTSGGYVGVMFPLPDNEWDEHGWFVDPIDGLVADRFGFGAPRSWSDAVRNSRGFEIPIWLLLCVVLFPGAVRTWKSPRSLHGSKYVACGASIICGICAGVGAYFARVHLSVALTNIFLLATWFVVSWCLVEYQRFDSYWSLSKRVFPGAVACAYSMMAAPVIVTALQPPPIHFALLSVLWTAVVLTVISAALPVLLRSLRDRRRQFPLRCCQGCGYDLQGNRSGICPECGTLSSPSQRTLSDVTLSE